MKGIKHFPAFDEFRFLAAFLVLIDHIELSRVKYKLFSLSGRSIVHQGSHAVTFFFVLSGFLITYLLLREEAARGEVSVRNFYIRRVLRIWPLYYIVVLTGLFLVPAVVGVLGIEYEAIDPARALPLYILMLPNLVTAVFGSNFMYPLWSIGVEEQFYLLWAPLMKFFRRMFVPICFAIVAVRLLFYSAAADGALGWNETATEFVRTLKFECMALGGLGAYAVFHRGERLVASPLFSIPAQLAVLSAILYGFFVRQVAGPLLEPLLYVHLLISAGACPRSAVRLQNRALARLGEISYGIYMYHAMVVFGLLVFIRPLLGKMGPVTGTIFLYFLATAATVAVSSLSYRAVEKPIIGLKKRLRAE